MKEERIFTALGNVDPALLARSEKKARVLYWKPLVSLAACLAVVLGLVSVVNAGTEVTPPGPTPPPVQSDQPSRLPALILNGGEVGELTLCRDYREEQAGPGFVIFVNQSIYAITQEEESWVIRPKDALGAEYPPIDMTITHLPGTAPGAALQERQEALGRSKRQKRDFLSRPPMGTRGTLLRPRSTGWTMGRGVPSSLQPGTSWRRLRAMGSGSGIWLRPSRWCWAPAGRRSRRGWSSYRGLRDS